MTSSWLNPKDSVESRLDLYVPPDLQGKLSRGQLVDIHTAGFLRRRQDGVLWATAIGASLFWVDAELSHHGGAYTKRLPVNSTPKRVIWSVLTLLVGYHVPGRVQEHRWTQYEFNKKRVELGLKPVV